VQQPTDLSVSAIGSNRLQQKQFFAHHTQTNFFQYPQSDRIVCNLPVEYEVTALFKLSVSAIGSNRLQLVALRCFSRVTACFQYPQSDRIVCNVCHGV
jgi:hypothetical protein